MEQHAVPQDITGFKFKLVGDMTLKQFGELAAGAVIAYIFYISGLHPLIKWPLVLFFAFLGFALAFLPIEERPLDIWLVNFFRSVYKPTLYIWKKSASSGPNNYFASPLSQSSNLLPPPITVTWPYKSEGLKPEEKIAPKNSSDQEEKKISAKEPGSSDNNPVLSIEDLQRLRDQRLFDLGKANQRIKTPPPHSKLNDIFNPPKPNTFITIDDLARRRDEQRIADQTKLRELQEQNAKLEKQIEELQRKIQALEGADTSSLQAQINNLLQEKDKLAQDIITLQDKLHGKPVSFPSPPPTSPSPAFPDAHVRVVEKPVVKQASIALTDVPNVLNGIVTDERNAPLDNVILTVKDKAGNAIRALKTNQLGQFIASTPLPNGTYYLEFERQNYTFETLEVTLDGKVIAPIQIYGYH